MSGKILHVQVNNNNFNMKTIAHQIKIMFLMENLSIHHLHQQACVNLWMLKVQMNPIFLATSNFHVPFHQKTYIIVVVESANAVKALK
jgi:hypothetical protein